MVRSTTPSASSSASTAHSPTSMSSPSTCVPPSALESADELALESAGLSSEELSEESSDPPHAAAISMRTVTITNHRCREANGIRGSFRDSAFDGAGG